MNSNNRILSDLKKWINEGIKEIHISDLSGSARSYFISQLLIELEKPCLIILPTVKYAEKLYRELEFFLPELLTISRPELRRLYDFPAYDISPLSGLSPHRNIVTRRLQALHVLTSEENPIVITSIEAIISKVLPKAEMSLALEYLETGEEVDREKLIKTLETNGYLRTSMVEEIGDYSVRGGVMDIFPPLYGQPVRLEFWGEQLESIRHFDPSDQRSTKELRDISILPASEIIMSQDNLKRSRSMGRLPDQGSEGFSFPGQEAWLNHFYKELNTLLDYFPYGGVVFFFDPRLIDSERKKIAEKYEELLQKYRKDAGERGYPFPETNGIVIPESEIKTLFDSYQCVSFSNLKIGETENTVKTISVKGATDVDVQLELRVSGKGRVSMAPLAEKVADWSNLGSKIVLVCRTEQQAGRLEEILGNYNVKVEEVARHWSKVSRKKMISVCLGRLSKGFIWPEVGLYVISEDEIFGPKHSKTRAKDRKGEETLDWTSFSQLKVGDLVVHQEHGIGRYGGLEKMEIEKKVNDFVIIEYLGNDRLYTPADRISILQKYVGADEKEPRLDRLGGRSWNIAKKKAKKSVMEIARQLIDIYALRKYREGFAFSRPDNYFKEPARFEGNVKFSDSDDPEMKK